jgi:tetratricopeptide (TPR) repeat protein
MKLPLLIATLFSLLVSCSKIDVPRSLEQTKTQLKEENWEGAVATITPCLPAARNTPEIYVLAALSNANAGNKKTALDLCQQAQSAFDQLGSPSAEAYAHIGAALISCEEFDEAVKVLEKSLSQEPQNVYAASLLIEAEYHFYLKNQNLRKYALLNKHLKRAGQYKELKDSVEFYNLLAVTSALGFGFDRDLIEKNLTKAYLKNKKNPVTLLNLAVIYDSVFKKHKRAAGFYKMYLEAVKYQPSDDTQEAKVRRRLTTLRNQEQ